MGATALSLTGGGIVWSWWDVAPDTPYQLLSTEEAQMVNALSQAAFPSGQAIALSGKDAQLDYFFDRLLFGMTGENQKLLKLLLQALNRLAILSQGNDFLHCTESEQQLLVEKWLTDESYLFRSAMQSVIVLLSIGYTSHPKASKHLQQYFRCGFGQ